MPQLAENAKQLNIIELKVDGKYQLVDLQKDTRFSSTDVIIANLPLSETNNLRSVDTFIRYLKPIKNKMSEKSVLIIIGEMVDLAKIEYIFDNQLNYQVLFAIKRSNEIKTENKEKLTNSHIGALILTKYKNSLNHLKTRLPYTYCPACKKTTKDYGGRKHLYHEYGTLMSDVWTDIELNGNNYNEIFSRFAAMFGLPEYENLLIIDLQSISYPKTNNKFNFSIEKSKIQENIINEKYLNDVKNGDSLQLLSKIPDNSVDFVFADPPYNLQKKYTGYDDDREIQNYFTWCDKWMKESLRILKPGRTFAVLNIPIWAIRHLHYLEKIAKYQNWIVWDALAFPVRYIMPAHYTILSFTKGISRPLPGLIQEAPKKYLKQDVQKFCRRARCIKERRLMGVEDKEDLFDIWSDIPRLRHNSRREDHPCQLPPVLMKRLISIFTYKHEIVLDPFNGVGTTTLSAHQMGRNFIGFDISEKYTKIAKRRHDEISQGKDPFRKRKKKLTEKNSPVPRVKNQNYEVPKKELQLEVKRVSKELGHIPNREELKKFGKYKIRYYDDYFSSWGEVCAAARTTGMSETKTDTNESNVTQPNLFLDD